MSSSDSTPVFVTLVVVYAKQTPIRIRMDEAQAAKVVVHSAGGMTVSRPFSGYDADQRPYRIEVGDAALAVYTEPVE